MRPIDPAFLYETGARIRPIKTLVPEMNSFTAYSIIWDAKDAINDLILNSVYSAAIRLPVKNSAMLLVASIDELMKKILESDDLNSSVGPQDINIIKNNSLRFETLLLAEVQSLSIYLVGSKGGFDVACLISEGNRLFPDNLIPRAPWAYLDVVAGARCMAFELWTAMAFHFHRANEAVLREYFDMVAGKDKRPKIRTMGTMLSELDKLHVGDPNIRAALRNLVNLHRNPIIHPPSDDGLTDDAGLPSVIETENEAISLYAAIRAAMGYMLDDLPDIEPEKLKTILQALQPTPLIEQ